MTRVAALVLAALAGALLPSCKCGATKPPPAASATPAKPALPPLSAEGWLVALPVPGFGSASVAVPLGAIEPRPLVIALHGGADRPEWQCGTWVGIARSRPFVLCPRGVPTADPPGAARYGWDSTDKTLAELRAALKALKARFGAHVAPGPVVLAGFSTGTRAAVELARQEASFFSRLVLVAPEDDLVTPGLAGVFRRGGGRSVLLVCSDASCKSAAQRYALFLRGAGAATKLLELPQYGRVLDARVASAIAAEYAWLVEGDARFVPEPAPKPAAVDGG